jgi:hypothetical protein
MRVMSDHIAANSAAQPHENSEQMQRWLNTPRRQEPYVVGHGMANKTAELCAEVNEALSILQKSPRNGKQSQGAHQVGHTQRSFCNQSNN